MEMRERGGWTCTHACMAHGMWMLIQSVDILHNNPSNPLFPTPLSPLFPLLHDLQANKTNEQRGSQVTLCTFECSSLATGWSTVAPTCIGIKLTGQLRRCRAYIHTEWKISSRSKRASGQKTSISNHLHH